MEALGFTLWVFKAEKIGVRDLYKGSKRAFGELMEHTIRGKIAELAFKNFMKERHGTELLTEVDLPIFMEGDYLPDVVGFKQGGNWGVPGFWVDIKAEQEGQKWMLIRKSSLLGGKTKRTKVRRYDTYVNVLVKLPADHLARILKHVPNIGERISSEMVASLTDLSHVDAEVLGYALLSDLTDILDVEKGEEAPRERLDAEFGRNQWAFFAEGENAYDPDTKQGGAEMGTDNCAISLAHLRSDWKRFPQLLSDKGRSLDIRRFEQRSLEDQMESALSVLAKSGTTSWFQRPFPPKSADLSRWLREE